MGGERGAGAREKGYGSRERKEREAGEEGAGGGSLQGEGVGDHVDKRFKEKYIK